MDDSSLTNISPIDGRYASKTQKLNSYFSEYAFIRYRILIEVEYLIALSKIEIVEDLTEEETQFLKKLYSKFSIEDAKTVKEIEKEINHDVKSIEYYLKKAIDDNQALNDKGISNFVHFALTSQDINSSANMIMIKSANQKVILPKINEILKDIKDKILKWSKTTILSRTHGQPASPTKLGKEINVFKVRIENQIKLLKSIPISAKFGGAKVLIKPASNGTGVKAGGAMRSVLESAGVKDVFAKS